LALISTGMLLLRREFLSEISLFLQGAIAPASAQLI
jgi:hypothetical protein